MYTDNTSEKVGSNMFVTERQHNGKRKMVISSQALIKDFKNNYSEVERKKFDYLLSKFEIMNRHMLELQELEESKQLQNQQSQEQVSNNSNNISKDNYPIMRKLVKEFEEAKFILDNFMNVYENNTKRKSSKTINALQGGSTDEEQSKKLLEKMLADAKHIHHILNMEIKTIKENEAEFGYPKVTLVKLSKYELAGIITTLANYLNTKTTLYPMVSADTVINGPINIAGIAYEALKKGVIDVIIDRGYEQVLFSKLKINPIWETDLENFFKRWQASANEMTEKLISAI